MMRRIIICIFSLVLAASADDAADYLMTQTVTFRRSSAAYFADKYPTNLRVNLDLSLDGGSNWTRRIAHGIPAHAGENSYTWSFLATPDMWTEHARIGVRTLWSSATNTIMWSEGDMSDANFAICGVRILAPTNNTIVYQPSYMSLTWHEAGPDTVDIGVSTNAGYSYTKLYTVTSTNATNSYMLPIINLPTGRLDFVVQAFSNLYATVTVEVRNQ